MWRHRAIQAAIATDVPVAEVDWLLQEVAGLDRLALRLESFKNWPQIQLELPLEDLEQLWQRRLHDRLPVQYIARVTPWRHFKIAVSSAVLIPRPETECLIDLAVTAANSSEAIPPLNQGHWVDLGTGSGAIALGLANVFPESIIHAVDYSPEALAIAAANAQNLGFADRIRFYLGSWWEPLQPDSILSRFLVGAADTPQRSVQWDGFKSALYPHQHLTYPTTRSNSP